VYHFSSVWLIHDFLYRRATARNTTRRDDEDEDHMAGVEEAEEVNEKERADDGEETRKKSVLRSMREMGRKVNPTKLRAANVSLR
jgi:hypothetical protein